MTRKLDLEAQFRDVRKQLQDQIGCLDSRMDSKLTLLNEFQEFFKKRGEVESEYSRSLEKLCERFERNTKQRNIRSEVRSTFNLWSTLLAETRKQSRERGAVAEVWSQEMSARIAIMQGDVNFLTKRCKEMCAEIQEQYLKEIRDYGELTKLYQHSCHNVAEAIEKHARSKEKESTRQSRKKKAEEKEKERQRQYKALCHQLLKNRNDYIMGMTKCNSFSLHYFNRDILELVEYMDYDYHDSFKRLAEAYRMTEKSVCSSILQSADIFVEQAKALNFETDLNYFLNEFSASFHPPSEFQFLQFEGNEVTVYKVNTEDVYTRSLKAVESLTVEKNNLEAQRDEDEKTIRHMKQLNLMKYKVISVEDAARLVEENGDTAPTLDSSLSRNTTLEKGLSVGAQTLQQSQKGKRDTLMFTLQIVQRNLHRSDQLEMINTQLNLLEAALAEQKVKPIPVQTDAHGRTIPGEVPKLFGGNLLEYIVATGNPIPLIVESCVRVIEKDGLNVEGLFRVPGPSALIDELRKGFEEGRDPLATSKQKVDHTAVASVLKAFFRELETPLFPTEKYQEFIMCARKDDSTDRLNAIQATIETLPHPIVTVMAYLFRFLYRVSLEAKDNKMGSANLALVFGPTLTRAPGNMDPRQLHNDVPAVNVLIQLCINFHRRIFRREEEEEDEKRDGEEAPPTPLSPVYNPTISPSNTMETISPSLDQKEEEVCVLPSPIPTSTTTTTTTTSAATVVQDAPPPPCEDTWGDKQPCQPGVVPPSTALATSTVAVPTTTAAAVAADTTLHPQTSVQQLEPEVSNKPAGMTSQVSNVSLTQDFKTIEEALKSIEGNLVEMACVEEEEEEEDKGKELGDEGTEDSESDGETEDDVLKIQCWALYDYTARSDKELSFKRGDQLQVIEKTPDSNWWDGFHEGKRGFIPVSYVEIAELQPSEEGEGGAVKSIPQPPQRKSSMRGADDREKKVSEEPGEVSIAEEEQRARLEATPSPPPVATDPPAGVVDPKVPPVALPPSAAALVLPPESGDKPSPSSSATPVAVEKAPPAEKPVEKPATPVHRAVPLQQAERPPEKPVDKPAETSAVGDKPVESSSSSAAADKPTADVSVTERHHSNAKEDSQPPPPPPSQETSDDTKKGDKAAHIEKASSLDKPPPPVVGQGVKGNVSKLKAQFSAEQQLPEPQAHIRQRSDGHKLNVSDVSPSEDMSRSASASSGSKGTPEDLSVRTLSSGSKTGNANPLPPSAAKVVVAPPPTRPRPPPTVAAPTSAPSTTTTTSSSSTAGADPPGAFTITSHAAGISPLQRAAAVAAVSAVVAPKPPPPMKTQPTPAAAAGGKVKRNSSQKEDKEKPATPAKPKGDKTADMLRAELQAAMKGRPPAND